MQSEVELGMGFNGSLPQAINRAVSWKAVFVDVRFAKSSKAAEREHSGPDSLGAQAISMGAATSIVFNSLTAVDAS